MHSFIMKKMKDQASLRHLASGSKFINLVIYDLHTSLLHTST